MLPILRDTGRDLFNLQRRFNELFNDLWRGDFPSTFPEESSGIMAWSPRVDVEETNDSYIVHADLPGINKNDVKVTLKDNVLTIHGERKHEDEKKEKNYHRVERAYGSFHRTFTLPTTVKGEDIKADYKNGVLVITLPKAEEAKPKEIKIS